MGVDRESLLSHRGAWLIGPIVTSIFLFGASQSLSHRFDAGLPLAREISAEFIGWLVLGATIGVAAVWLACWRLAATRRHQPFGAMVPLPTNAAGFDLVASGQRRSQRVVPSVHLSALPRRRSDDRVGLLDRIARRSDGESRPLTPGLSNVGPEAGNHPRLLRCLAWSVALNLPFVVTGQIWHSYDFSTHVFFASHYQRDWWSLWEPRWFEGFNVASYPPLTHQIAALLGWITGTETAVNLLTAASVIAFPFVLHLFARQFVAAPKAAYIAGLAVVSPSVFLAGYAFGQLPTLFALDVSLIAAAALTTFLRRGGVTRLATALALAGAAAAAHHATLIFLLPPLFGTIILLEALRGDVGRAVQTRRAVVAMAGSALIALLVILPFWLWYVTERVAQLPIDHQSRHNFLLDPVAQDEFFWAVHGVLIAALVVAWPLLRRQPRTFLPWYLLAIYLVTIGLGGTTPVPRLLFGPFWEWLTYDRFSIWADVPLLVLLGAATATVLRRITRRSAGGFHGSYQSRRRIVGVSPPPTLPRTAWLATIGLLAIVACSDALLPALIQTEPVPVDPQPIVTFLSVNARDGSGQRTWRYLTLGFGDQAGLIHARTDAGTPDGYFFTARRQPLLTQSGIASLDYSLLWDPAAKALRSLLLQPAPAHLRWAFTVDPGYQKILGESGWRQTETLSNGVGVWETSQTAAPVGPIFPQTGILAIWWGIAPLATLAAGLALGLKRWLGRGVW